MKVLIGIGLPQQKEAGAASVVLHHARELEKRGHDVDCLFLEDVLTRPARPKRLEALWFAIELAQRIRRNPGKWDVVNIHAPWGCAYGVWRKILGPADSPPYVLTMHGSEGRYVEAMRAEDRKGRAWNFGWKNRAWHRVYHQLMFNGSIKTADYGLVVSEEGREYAERMCGAPGRFEFLPNGVEETFFTPREYSARGSLRLLGVGTWLDRKGVFYLAEAFARLVQLAPDLRLTVAGCLVAEEEVRSFFAPEIRARVDVARFVARADMPAMYASHDIFVLPSLVEGMPLSLLEAMASGMPVVTTKTGGMLDMIADGVDGLLVAPADAEALAAAAERVVKSAELRSRIGRAARERVRRQTWSDVVGKLEKVLERAATNARPETAVALNAVKPG